MLLPSTSKDLPEPGSATLKIKVTTKKKRGNGFFFCVCALFRFYPFLFNALATFCFSSQLDILATDIWGLCFSPSLEV